MSMNYNGVDSTTPRQYGGGVGTSPRSGGGRGHYTTTPLSNGGSQPSTRESVLEEKSIFLANELAARDVVVERLERENLEQMRQISRIRREMQARLDEEVKLMSLELREVSREAEALRKQRSKTDVARRVREELQKLGVTPTTTTPTPATVTKNKKSKAGDDKVKQPQKSKSTKSAPVDEKLRALGGHIPLGQTPVLQSKVCQMGDTETVRGKKSGKYKGIGPQAAGDVIALFEDGLAYRIEGDDGWHFYNDTSRYELHLNWEFGPESRIATEGDACASENEEGWTVVNCVVYPDETKPFISGSINGWKSAYSLKPLSDAYRAKLTAAADAGVMKELRVVERLCADNGIDTQDDSAVLAICQSNRAMFVDLNFRPNSRSVSRPGQDEPLPVVPWQRPMQYLPPSLKETICLFNTIDPNDIDQGALGDCWFLCAMASIAEFPDLVRAIYSPNGASDLPGQKAAYKLRLNKNGWFRDIVVDSFLPTTGGSLCFAKTCETPGELWVPLLEKAYAKLHGSYAAISLGYPLHALIDLTGFAGMNISPRMEESRNDPAAATALFNDMAEWDSKDFMISVGTPGVDESDYNVGRTDDTDADMAAKYKEAGLVNGHAYSVLKVKSFPGYGLRLLQIRNPWGNSKEWTGEWSDNDPRWSELPDVAAGCDFTDADDGTFWMPYSQFLNFFEDGQVVVRTKCRLDSRVKGRFSDGIPSTILKVSVSVPVDCMITLSQKDPRGLAEGDHDAKKQAMLLTLARGFAGGRLRNTLCSTGNPFKPSANRMFRYDRDQSMFVTLQPTGDGTAHYVLPSIYHKEVEKDYTIAIRVPPGAAHRGDIKVEFVSFSSDATPFQGYTTFSEDDCGISPCQTDCQALNRDTLVLKELQDQTSLNPTWDLCFDGSAPPTEAVPAAADIPADQEQEIEYTASGGAYNGNRNAHGGGGGRPGRGRGGRGRGGGAYRNTIGADQMEDLVARIDRFYEYYEPSKVGEHAVQVARKYQNQQELLFTRLTTKYGPEPEEEEEEDYELDYDAFFDEEEEEEEEEEEGDDDSWW